ncbi:MAG: hypothetical protein ACE37D_01540 [Pseudomonadales bacterium]
MRIALAVMICLATLTGCASSPKKGTGSEAGEVLAANLVGDVSLDYAASLANAPFNVSILLFDVAASGEKISRIYEPIRNAEAAYLPVLLKKTLDESGFWGAVSVVPSLDTASEVFVRGTILESTSLQLVLQLEVSDSRGEVWFTRTYADLADPADYDLDVNVTADPFQDLFDQVANDMGEYLNQVDSSAAEGILDTAMLRYAMLLSPEAFSGYLQTSSDGRVDLMGLPARNDPLYQRVRQIRSREYAVQDVVDEHFDNFFADMGKVYPYWRQSSYELIAYNNKIELQRNTGRQDSWREVERVYRLYKERKLNEDELRELASSFEREIEPTVAELEGRVIELQGSLFDQYKTWRRILREIYQNTVGELPVSGS